MTGEGREQQNQNAGKRRMIWLVLLAMLLAAGALAIPLFVHTGEEPENPDAGAIVEDEVAGEDGEAEAFAHPAIHHLRGGHHGTQYTVDGAV